MEAGRIAVTGQDVNHMKNVLRIRPGEEILISDGTGRDYRCLVERLDSQCVETVILEAAQSDRELPSRIWLFQGLPKSDKMELIIQKAVELGAAAIVPVATRNAVVKLDGKKAESKVKRWQAIAESAAKQSRRSVIPKVYGVMSLKEAYGFVKEKEFAVRMIPYEKAEGMEATRSVLEYVGPGQDIAVFIGPEGGFEEEEVRQALEAGVLPVSLGKRILRTETAGLAVLSVLMMKLEGGL